LLIGILLGALFHTALAASGLVAMSGIAVYALCGMMALASPVIGAPLTTIIIVFELTRNYDITIATMVAVVFSNLVAHRVFGRSLFDVQLARQGIDLSAGRDQARLEAIPVSSLAVRDYPAISAKSTMAEAIKALRDTRWRTGFAVDADGRFAGLLELGPHESNARDAVASALVAAPLIFDETTNVMQAMRGLRGFVGQAVPVIDSESGVLTGVVTEASIIECYLDMSHGLRREENAPL
jgi:CIC family chloride channel protein